MFGVEEIKGYSLVSNKDIYEDLFFLKSNVCKDFMLENFKKEDESDILKESLLLSKNKMREYLKRNTPIYCRRLKILFKDYLIDESIINNLIKRRNLPKSISRLINNTFEKLIDAMSEDDELLTKFILTESKYDFQWPTETIMEYNSNNELITKINVLEGYPNIVDIGRLCVPANSWKGVKFGGPAEVNLVKNEKEHSYVRGKMLLSNSASFLDIMNNVGKEDDSVNDIIISTINLEQFGMYYTDSDCSVTSNNTNTVDLSLFVNNEDKLDREEIIVLTSDLQKYLVLSESIGNIKNKCKKFHEKFKAEITDDILKTGYFSNKKWVLIDNVAVREKYLMNLFSRDVLSVYKLPIKSAPKLDLRYIIYNADTEKYWEFAECSEEELEEAINIIKKFNNRTTEYIKSVLSKNEKSDIHDNSTESTQRNSNKTSTIGKIKLT